MERNFFNMEVSESEATFKLVPAEIPPDIRRIQEWCGFSPGEQLNHKNFLKLILVKRDEEKDTEEKKAAERKKNDDNKKKMPVSVKASGTKKKGSDRESISVKEKAYKNWGAPKNLSLMKKRKF